MSVVDEKGQGLRPIELETGQRAQVYAASARSGARKCDRLSRAAVRVRCTEHEHPCDDEDAFAHGRPFVVSPR